MRASSGSSSLFGFTGEQTDPTTGYSYLRARDLNPELGRLLSRDTVQPNAPGSQGYNVYAYVANNPTTWVDPSGHVASIVAACMATGWCAGLIAIGVYRMSLGALAALGGWPIIVGALLLCALDIVVEIRNGQAILGGCFGLAGQFQKLFDTYGSGAKEGAYTGSPADARTAANDYPADPGSYINQTQVSWPDRLPKVGDYPYIPPKNTPDGMAQRNRQGEYVDQDSNRWRWDPRKAEWDVQHRDGSHTNVDPGGEITHGPDNFPRIPH